MGKRIFQFNPGGGHPSPAKERQKIFPKISKRRLFYIGIFAILLFLLFFKIILFFIGDHRISRAELMLGFAKEKNGNMQPDSSQTQSEEDASLIKLHLLKKLESTPNLDFAVPARNIFTSEKKPVVTNTHPINGVEIDQTAEKEVIDVSKSEQNMPGLHLRLIGIILRRTDASQDYVRYAILSGEDGVFIVKKGDLMDDRYEILNIDEENVEIKDLVLDKTEILSLEK